MLHIRALENKSEMSAQLIFCCDEENDLYKIVSVSGLNIGRIPDPITAVNSAGPGSAVLVLADDYPDSPTAIDAELYDLAARRNVRLYVEYPSFMPGIEVGDLKELDWERGVICSDVFGVKLPQMSLLSLHRCKLQSVGAVDEPWITAARVAGFDKAIYGLPEQVFPLLFKVAGRELLITTTKLSNAITARYAPTAAWKVIWERIFDILQPGVPHDLIWTADVRPTYSADDPLPADYQRQAMNRGVKWFINSRLLLNKDRQLLIYELLKNQIETTPTPDVGYLSGNGSFGIQEGFCSSIDACGDQTQRVPMRADCNAESAMALAFDWLANRNDESRRIAENLFDYVFFTSGMHSGPVRANPEHPAFGLISWGIGNRIWERAFYGDDDARVILAAIVGAASLESRKYDENIARALLANLRTTGKLGFRGERIDIPDIERNGWKHYADSELVHPAPHFESYLWACNLWAYRQTGYEPFLEKAKSAIKITMRCYPDGWKWANGIAQERARMLLCLAWLVRVEDTPEHREWLKRMASIVLSYQQPCGAIREELGGGSSWAGAIVSNEAYGTAEASLIQSNGDPVADMLYTCNFALLGLHEAVAATGDPELKAAEDKLAEFLCRIQIRSERIPYLDGGWFRAFDYKQWDYWASSSDLGWGAWSIETGWTQGWIATMLGIREQGTNVWDLTAGVRIADCFDKVQEDMAKNDGGPWTGEPWE